jgi:hypothetical protein
MNSLAVPTVWRGATSKATSMTVRMKELLRPFAVLAQPATALLGLTIGAMLGAWLLPQPLRRADPAPAAAQAMMDTVGARQGRHDADRRAVTQFGY